MTATVIKRIKRRNVAQSRRKLQLAISRSFGTRHPATRKVSHRSHIPFSIEFFFKGNDTDPPIVSHGELEGPYIYTDPNNTHTVTPIWIPGFSILMSWFCREMPLDGILSQSTQYVCISIVEVIKIVRDSEKSRHCWLLNTSVIITDCPGSDSLSVCEERYRHRTTKDMDTEATSDRKWLQKVTEDKGDRNWEVEVGCENSRLRPFYFQSGKEE